MTCPSSVARLIIAPSASVTSSRLDSCPLLPHTPAPALSHSSTDGWLGSVVQLWSSSLRASWKHPHSHFQSSCPLPPATFYWFRSSRSYPDENIVRNPKLVAQLRKLITLPCTPKCPQHPTVNTFIPPRAPSNRSGLLGPHKSLRGSGQAKGKGSSSFEWAETGPSMSLHCELSLHNDVSWMSVNVCLLFVFIHVNMCTLVFIIKTLSSLYFL